MKDIEHGEIYGKENTKKKKRLPVDTERKDVANKR